jgi:hypothetical protein
MLMTTSLIAISLPFAGTLAWTPYALVGAAGFLRGRRFAGRVAWLGLAAFAWGQVAASHMSHGLAMATVAVGAYVVARSARDVRAGEVSWRGATVAALVFFIVLPLANMAIVLPRVALFPQTSLRAGYASVGGAVARLAGIAQQPLAPTGVWAGWPLALGSTPGVYAGAVVLLAIPLAARAWGRRYLVGTFVAIGVISYLLTLNAFVSAGWFRALVLHLPYGDVYLHNPGRLRYLMFLAVPVLGAVGIQALVERPLPPRRLAPWLAASAVVFLVAPLVFGGVLRRYAVLVIALPFATAALVALGKQSKRAALLVTGVLVIELVASAIASQTYRGGTVLTGLENTPPTTLSPGPLKWPDVSVKRYLTPGPIARAMTGTNGRFLTWVPPAAFYNKGYLFTQDPVDWMALENGRGMLFRLRDSMGYSPVQLTRYWSFIRATNDGAPLFYNAAILQHPSMTDARLLGIRWLIVPSDVKPPLPARRILTPGPFHGGRYTLYEVRGHEPLVSVVPDFRVAPDGAHALRKALRGDFDPAREAVVQVHPGIHPSVARAGTARVRVSTPEDIRISVTAAAPSLVVVRNSFDNHWHATVDGRDSPLLATDYFLQSVPVRAGHHVIRLV